MSRRQQILDIAAVEFAKRGFHGVTIDDLGKACGISGPALYKHFASKDALLAEMLVSISERLLEEGRRRADIGGLSALIEWHVNFALEHPALIVVQDRDWASLPDDAREQVRRLQREYVDVWTGVLRTERPSLTRDEGRAMVHATFGLINSTPRSQLIPEDQMRGVLIRMATAAIRA